MTDLLTPGLVALAVAALAAAGPPAITVTTGRADDRAVVTTGPGKATVAVHSPFGISRAVLRRAGRTWPDAVVLRLHLSGLEHFTVRAAGVTLDGAVSLSDGKPVERLWKDGREDAPLDARSPYWMAVRIVGGDGRAAQALPLAGGYFELPLPRALFDGNPTSVTVRWVDFFRG